MPDQETTREKSGYITSKDTIENVYPGLILAINPVRQLEKSIPHAFMETSVYRCTNLTMSEPVVLS